MTITDELLYQAAPLAAERYLETLPRREDCGHAFSPEFEAKMRPLLAGTRRRGRPWKRLLVLAAVITALAAGGVSVYAERDDAYRVDWTQEDGFVSYHVRAERDLLGCLHRMGPGYLPEGFSLQSESTGEQSRSAYYKGRTGGTLSVHQTVRERKSGVILGGAQGKSADIGGQDGMLVLYNGDQLCLLWTDGPNILELNAAGLSEEEILKIAEHMSYQGGTEK